MTCPIPRRALLLAPFLPIPALAQDRPVRLLIGMPAGAAPDLLTRLLAERLAAGLGQAVIVENRPGATGNLAAAALARAAPDGGTIGTLLGATLAINRHLYPELPFDPARDFAPLLRFARFPGVVLVPREAPVAGLAELGPWLRGLGRPALVATPGAGTIPHLAAEMLLRAIGVPGEMVHYRGDPDALRDLAAGRVQLMVAPLPAALPQVEAGRARALAVTAAARTPLAPGLPAVAETVPGFVAESWLALGAPAGLPAPQAERLVALARGALADPALAARFAALGAEIPGEAGAALAAVIAAEDARWGGVIRDAGVRLD
jgi:tripartite-type tricarboxylate transporter receptor subunit TctC